VTPFTDSTSAACLVFVTDWRVSSTCTRLLALFLGFGIGWWSRTSIAKYSCVRQLSSYFSRIKNAEFTRKLRLGGDHKGVVYDIFVLQCSIVHAYFKSDIHSLFLRSEWGVLGEIFMRVGIQYCTVRVRYSQCPGRRLSISEIPRSPIPSEVR